MNKENYSKIKSLKIQLYAAIFVLLLVIILGGVMFATNLSNVALALNPADYNKGGASPQLDVADWNQLDADFVARDGGVVDGDLDMSTNRITNLANPLVNTDAANLQSVNSAITSALSTLPSGSITDTGGATLKMVCGSVPITFANTTNPFNRTLLVTIDTSAAGFTGIPTYLSSMDGLGNHYRLRGVNTIYNPQINSYQIYLIYYNHDVPSYMISVTDAVTWGWTINWCGIGA